ncbi:GSCOCG00011626001-RA-CDS [Cotesia congregata]|nr:GSCOCG00011626001-RA-CDS [Cotesia congregata]
MPSITINQSSLDIPKNIKLADPDFFKSSKVDALIGVKLFYELLVVGQISLKNHPNAILQKTQLGWVVAGEIGAHSQPSLVSCHFSIHSDPPDVSLTRFWEIEELSSNTILSPEEKVCEEHYALNTTRNTDGRYEVRLPFNDKKAGLGESYSVALKRFYALERKFQQKTEIQRDYIAFLDEYLALGHMSLAKDQNTTGKGFFLPHHAVIKEDSITTKTRVFFDGSAKTSTGISLNDTLMVGPKLQDDLLCILLRFRSHIYVLTADAEKMYRQVRVNSEDTPYQKILYRRNTSEPIQIYTLETTTYGTSSASYLAIKTLYKLADDEEENFPIAAQILRRDFYVDDVLTGAQTISEAIILRDQLISLLKKGGFYFIESSIWIDGPLWLTQENSAWPKGVLTPIDIPDLKPLIPKIACLKIEIKEYNIIERFSSFSRMQRVIACILRFIHNIKKPSSEHKSGPLLSTELVISHDLIIRLVQSSCFKKEIESIKAGELLPSCSKLIPLNPIINDDDILRVGGRLAHSSIAEEQRHPILLPAQHHVTKLIIKAEHFRLKHAGMQATLYSVRQNYWPLNGRSVTRSLIRKCVPCFRVKPRLGNHPMETLPTQRVTSSHPFLRVGVDYYGPFYIKKKRHRNRGRVKVYVAVYICMCTKAVHLELVSDLTTEAFLASLKRLFSRRGKAIEIHSDNATNFVGAKNELNELYDLFNSKEHKKIITEF